MALCPKCKGTGVHSCHHCHGAGTVASQQTISTSTGDVRNSGEASAAAGTVPCPSCHGVGNEPCRRCDGAGEVDC